MDKSINVDFAQILQKYSNTIYRIALVHTQNYADAQDIVQDTFMKYVVQIRKNGAFETEEYEKAWLIRVTLNKCTDLKKSWISKLSELTEVNSPSENFTEKENNVLKSIRMLPEKYRDTIYLFYIEGYSVQEICSMTGMNRNTVKTHLSRGRKQLKNTLREEFAYEI